MDYLEYMTAAEAAEYLRSSKSTLAKRRLTGDGPRYLRIGRAIRYARSELDEWIARSARRSTSEPDERARPGAADPFSTPKSVSPTPKPLEQVEERHE
jgi:excisionase family DNA binding protein